MPLTTAPPAAANGQKNAPPPLLVPFTRAADEHIEPFLDFSQLLSAQSVQQGPFDVPAYGYMRSVLLLVQATGGVGGGNTVAIQEDAPWSVIQEVSLIDVNGAPIVGPFAGYDLYLINKYGGYRVLNDPKSLPTFSAPVVGAGASGNFTFSLRLPIEVTNRDGLGSLPNQNASSTYKLRITIGANTLVYTVAPATTQPTVRVRGYLEAWTQPAATDLRGHQQATVPPAVGTTAYWSKQIANINAGQQTVRFARVGNYLRNLIFIFRDVNGARIGSLSAVANFPDPLQVFYDTRLLHNFTKLVWQQIMAERMQALSTTIDAAGGLDSDVFFYDFCHEFDGRLGNELRDGYLPTVQSTRLEVFGSFGIAGSFTVLTNDVSPNGEIFV